MRQPRQLLITGVPGWLAAALLEDLARNPWPELAGIRCLVEPGAKLSDLMLSSDGVPLASCQCRGADCQSAEVMAPSQPAPHAAIEIVRGDLRDADALRAAVQGVDTVLHAAGIVHARRTRDWYDVNTAGTRLLAEAAATSGVERLVFISSNAAAGRAESRDRPLTEADPPRPLSHYGRSKWLAERAVLAMAGRIEPVVLRPCMFYGPPVPRRHVDIYRRILHGRMPLVGGGDFARSLTHVDNLVQGCRLAMTHAAAVGQTYYITDEPVYTTREIVEAMADALGTSPRFLRLPRLTATVAYAVDRTLAAMGCYWQTVHLVGESDWHVGVSCDKARRELGYRPARTLAEGMREAVAWCVEKGLLPK
jgi:nucleoside-diphosphate-sugar epimerase